MSATSPILLGYFTEFAFSSCLASLLVYVPSERSVVSRKDTGLKAAVELFCFVSPMSLCLYFSANEPRPSVSVISSYLGGNGSIPR